MLFFSVISLKRSQSKRLCVILKKIELPLQTLNLTTVLSTSLKQLCTRDSRSFRKSSVYIFQPFFQQEPSGNLIGLS